MRGFVAALALAAATVLGGCGGDTVGLAPETDDPLFKEGQQLSRQGRSQEALADYLKVITKRGDIAPESHLNAGLICLKDTGDPVSACYHFKKYLELAPNAPQAPYVRGLIDTAKRDFARTLPGDPMANPASGDATLMDRLERLERENEMLRNELAAARGLPAPADSSSVAAVSAPQASAGGGSALYTPAQPAASASDDSTPAAVPVQEAPEAAAQGPAAKAAQAPGRHYTVSAHDTLYGIAKKCYGSATNARVQAILQANRGVLSSPRDLKPGMELKIP